jgi:hypothetical protein
MSTLQNSSQNQYSHFIQIHVSSAAFIPCLSTGNNEVIVVVMHHSIVIQMYFSCHPLLDFGCILKEKQRTN